MHPSSGRIRSVSFSPPLVPFESAVHTFSECVTVFVVSGHEAIRDSISELVAFAVFRIEAFAPLEACRAAVRPDRAGCLVLDVGRNDPGGLQALGSMGPVCAVPGRQAARVHSARSDAVARGLARVILMPVIRASRT